nr:MAG TPA: hypothetical protein [Caudoviricetes sp.]
MKKIVYTSCIAQLSTSIRNCTLTAAGVRLIKRPVSKHLQIPQPVWDTRHRGIGVLCALFYAGESTFLPQDRGGYVSQKVTSTRPYKCIVRHFLSHVRQT